MKTKTYIIGKRKITITNIDKKFFPKNGYTKKDIVEYYRRITPIMLSHVKNHPLTMVGSPDGILGKHFFQQKIPKYFPEWINRITVPKRLFSRITHVLCNNKESLIYLAGQGFITLHAWPSLASNYTKPVFMIFDLDPPDGKSFEKVRFAAFTIKKFFEKYKIKTFVMTTGSRGLHIVVPIIPNTKFDEVRMVARSIAKQIALNNEGYLTDQLSKKKRAGRVFIDWTRNSYGQNTVVPYSVRLYPGAPIAAPISWADLKDKKVSSKTYNIKNIFSKIKRSGDAWKDIDSKKYSVGKIEKSIG